MGLPFDAITQERPNHMPLDLFYGIAAEEINRQAFDKDLMARAFAMALGDGDKTRAIYIGIRAERLEEQAREVDRAQQAAEIEKEQDLQRQAHENAAAKERERKEKDAARQNAVASEAAAKERERKEKDAARKSAEAQAREKDRLPNPADFTDPKIAAAVAAMREALQYSWFKK